MDSPSPITQPSVAGTVGICPLVSDIVGDFTVARIKSRQEKVFADELDRRAIGYFLPIRRESRVWGGRRRIVLLPLFPGIVFVGAGDDGREAAEQSRCVWGFLKVPDQRCLRRELIALDTVLSAHPDIESFPSLQESTAVRVRAGHKFEGIEGYIESRNGRERFCVRMMILGQSCPVEISPEFLEPI